MNTEQLYSCHSIFTTVIKDTVVVLSPMTIVIAINTEQLYSCHSIFTTVIKDRVVVLSPMTIMIAVTVKLCWTSLINVRQQGWRATMMSQILQLMHKITIVRLLIRLFHVSDNTNYSVYRCTKQNCQLQFTDPRMDSKSVDRLASRVWNDQLWVECHDVKGWGNMAEGRCEGLAKASFSPARINDRVGFLVIDKCIFHLQQNGQWNNVTWAVRTRLQQRWRVNT